ncbi:Enteropeptidase [Balamuthia mandrillaris]
MATKNKQVPRRVAWVGEGLLLLIVMMLLTSTPTSVHAHETEGQKAEEEKQGLSPKRIIEGEIVGEGEEYPWMGILYVVHPQLDPGQPIWRTRNCGCSLIASQYVLTAAHCFEEVRADVGGASASDFRAVFGLRDLRQLTVGQAEEELRVHRDVASTRRRVFQVELGVIDHRFRGDESFVVGDTALLKLRQKVVAGSGLVPVRLPLSLSIEQQQEQWTGRPVSMMGWGRTDGRDPATTSPVLRITRRLFVQSQEECVDSVRASAEALGGSTSFTTSEAQLWVCAASNPVGASGASVGDSGGPLFLEDENGEGPMQIGVMSFGRDYPWASPNGQTYPNVWTRISPDWLQQQVRVTGGSLEDPPEAAEDGADVEDHGGSGSLLASCLLRFLL